MPVPTFEAIADPVLALLGAPVAQHEIVPVGREEFRAVEVTFDLGEHELVSLRDRGGVDGCATDHPDVLAGPVPRELPERGDRVEALAQRAGT